MMRNKRVEIRFSDEEFAKVSIDAKARKMMLARFIRVTMTDAAPTFIPEINQSLLIEIRKVGVNINQLAKHANETENVEIEEFKALLAKMRLYALGD